jgi:hypothetical protein
MEEVCVVHCTTVSQFEFFCDRKLSICVASML